MSADNKVSLATIDLWGDYVIALYKSTMEVLWHINYHLRNPRKPAHDLMGPMHESYVKFEQDLDDDVKKIIEGAKGMKRDDFEKIYDEGVFAPSRVPPPTAAIN
jgi:hypothetical protein